MTLKELSELIAKHNRENDTQISITVSVLDIKGGLIEDVDFEHLIEDPVRVLASIEADLGEFAIVDL